MSPPGPPPPPPGPSEPLRDASVLLVIGNEDNPGEGDEELEQLLEDLGFDVDVEEDEEAALEDDGEDFGFILVVSSASAGALEDNFRNDRVPLLSMDSGLYEDMRMVDDEGQTDGQTQGRDINIVRDAHPLAAGLKGQVAIAAETSAIQWGVPSAEAEIIATLPGEPNRATIFAYDRGDSMEGQVAPDRRVGFFLDENVADQMSREAEQLVEAAVLWTWSGSTTTRPPPPPAR